MLDNPRFPHKLQIFRPKRDSNGYIVCDNNTGEEIVELVFESKCGFRRLVRGIDVDVKVIVSDFKLSLPRTGFIFRSLDKIRVIHSYTGEVIDGEVEIGYTNNLGSNVLFQSNSNKHG